MLIQMKRWQIWMLTGLSLLAFSACDKEEQPDSDDIIQQPDVFTAFAGPENAMKTRATLNPDNLRQFNWLSKEENGGTSETFTVYKEGDASCTPYTFTIDEETLSDDRATAGFKAESGFEAQDNTWLLATLPAGVWKAGAGSYTYTFPTEIPEQSGSATTGHIGSYMPMYAVGEAQDRQVNFGFHHLFTLLRFEIKNLNSTAASFTALKMETVETPVEAFGHSVTLTGDVSENMAVDYLTDDATASVSLNLKECRIEPDSVLTAYIPVLSGKAFAGNCSLKFTLDADGRTYSDVSLSDYSDLKLDGGKWAAGKIYTFRLLLDNEIHLESVTVSGWTEGEDILGGEAEETQPNEN